MKNTIIIIGVIALFFISAKLTEKPTPQKTEVTFVCNSAINAKNVMDTYFKLGYNFETMTVQMTAMTPNLNASGFRHFDSQGCTYQREYLVVLYK
jgi:hypothetical protein